MKKAIYYILFIFFITPLTLISQTTVSISDGSVNTCNGVLYDTGGVGASGYQNNERHTLTIYPDILPPTPHIN